MDLVVEYLPFLLLLYVVDGALYVRAGQLLFVSEWGGAFGAHRPGLRFPGLAPTAEAYVTAGLPLRASQDGVRIRGPRGRERLVRFDEMTKVAAADGTVLLAPGASLAVRPRELAADVARVVERLRTTPARRRLARLRGELRRRCDPTAIAALRSRQARFVPALRVLGVISAFAVAIALPASLVGEWPARPSPWSVGAAIAALYLATIAVSVAMLRACGVARGRTASAVLPLVLFPPAVAHAASIAGRQLYLGFEPLALGAFFLSRRAFAGLAREGRAEASPADGCWDLPAIVDTLVRRSARRAARRQPRPTPSESGAAAFCPWCLAEHRSGFERCSDCDVPLEPF